jgi:tripartite-type tricarboxylate transporter receptor subunit TctC
MRQHLMAIALAATIGVASAAAETYPTRPIRLVIPYPPGGVVDAIGRPWADRMKTVLGTVVVENIGGGDGGLGATAVSRAPADGYTILLSNSSSMVINPLVAKHVAYDPLGSFDAVSIIGQVAQAIAVHPNLPVRSLQELAEYAKRDSGKLSYGTPGVGSLSNLTGERFKLLVGSPDIVHVPYRGAGPAITNLIGGQIPLAIPAVNGQLLAFHRGGQLRILAVTSPHRLQGAPEIPTVVEAGMPELVVQATTWLLVPKGTPREIIDRISAATGKALAEPDLRRTYLESGVEPSSNSSPEAASRVLQDEIVHWTPIIKQIGLKPD